MPVKRILWFANYSPKGISVRYRGLYVLQEQHKSHGISYHFVYPGYRPKQLLHFAVGLFMALFFSRKHTAVVFQKLHTDGVYVRLLKVLLRLRPKSCFYDTDDADFLRYPPKNILFFIKHCSATLVGSQWLCRYVESVGGKPVFLSSAVIHHNHQKSEKNSLLHVGWIGDYAALNTQDHAELSHRESLHRLLFPALKKLNFEFKLTLLGIVYPKDKQEVEQLLETYPNIQLDIPLNMDWLNEEKVYDRIKNFDVGVSPMIDHDYNKAKSAFKAKQYLSCKVPVLASPTGENAWVVQHEKNGFVCHSPEDFTRYLTFFHSMPPEEYKKWINQIEDYKPRFGIQQYALQLLTELNKTLDH